jgi:hypothetical protein
MPSLLGAGARLPRNYSVRFPNCTSLITTSFKTLVHHFRPEIFQLACCAPMGVLFGNVWSPRHDFRSLADGTFAYSHLRSQAKLESIPA